MSKENDIFPFDISSLQHPQNKDHKDHTSRHEEYDTIRK